MKFESWHGDWNGQVAVFGLGSSGFSVADTLHELGTKVRVYSEKPDPKYADLLTVLGIELIESDGDEALADLNKNKPELIVTSPGFSPRHRLLEWADQNSILVVTDIDIAWRLRDKYSKVAEWFCVTGTNGKTTTVQLAEQMLIRGGINAISCGNIGRPILDVIRDPEAYDALVVELSSFQLHYMDEIFPFAAAVLNLAEDHIDWHGSMELYQQAKSKIFRNTKFACVYNVEDAVTEQMVASAEVVEGARAIGFTLGVPGLSMIGYVEDILADRAFLEDRKNSALEIATAADIAEIGITSVHLLQNVAAASALARAGGVSPADVKAAIRDFRMDSHRIQLVAEVAGVSYVNDSKATNAHAADASLASFENVVWIVGGLLKGVDPSPLIKRHRSRLSGVVLIGNDRSLLASLMKEIAPEVKLVEIDNTEAIMNSAVLQASKLASSGATVLLAPAAASMDQFLDYTDRGNQFISAVLALEAG